ncbi:MAG: hypothetical protein E7069_05085 [Bacteroidales bacterium]|jgi:hypothetical protein|nr:hypothetical protein [Bacteroidales bacterium]
MKRQRIALAIMLALGFSVSMVGQTMKKVEPDATDYKEVLSLAGYGIYNYDVSPLNGEDTEWHYRVCEHGEHAGLAGRGSWVCFANPQKESDLKTPDKLKMYLLPSNGDYKTLVLNIDGLSIPVELVHRVKHDNYNSGDEKEASYFFISADTLEVKDWNKGAWTVLAYYASAWNVSEDENIPFYKCCPCVAEEVKVKSPHYYTIEVSPRRITGDAKKKSGVVRQIIINQ